MLVFRAALLATAAVASLSSSVMAEDEADVTEQPFMRVDYDQATVVRLDRAAKTVVVGNPLIADALMLGDKLVYVQGRAFGNTNIIAVDAEGQEVLNRRVTVGAPTSQQVTLYRGAQGQRNLACAPTCERTVTQGDDKMEVIYSDADHKVDVSRKSADLATDRR